ncbi:hypothetical protein K474DRAFT_1666849 [Panus rudis PR-1116 ss-1]|nr:hypothetical protein K474DRAFT_1666849 [Panus rudis PR-1116 ss-1]
MLLRISTVALLFGAAMSAPLSGTLTSESSLQKRFIVNCRQPGMENVDKANCLPGTGDGHPSRYEDGKTGPVPLAAAIPQTFESSIQKRFIVDCTQPGMETVDKENCLPGTGDGHPSRYEDGKTGPVPLAKATPLNVNNVFQPSDHHVPENPSEAAESNNPWHTGDASWVTENSPSPTEQYPMQKRNIPPCNPEHDQCLGSGTPEDPIRWAGPVTRFNPWTSNIKRTFVDSDIMQLAKRLILPCDPEHDKCVGTGEANDPIRYADPSDVRVASNLRLPGLPPRVFSKVHSETSESIAKRALEIVLKRGEAELMDMLAKRA